MPTAAHADEIHGTPGDDVLVGTPGDDTFHGCGGSDRIQGLGGNDTISGDPGRDDLQGGDAGTGSTADRASTTRGSRRQDRVLTGPGDDVRDELLSCSGRSSGTPCFRRPVEERDRPPSWAVPE